MRTYLKFAIAFAFFVVLILSVAGTNILGGTVNILGYTRISNLNATKASLGATNVTDLIMRYPYYDVRAFGAKGDGVTNDWAAIQTAINASNGGTILIPDGRYIINKTLLITTSNVQLLGMSDTMLIMGRNANKNMINITGTGVRNVQIRNMLLHGANQNQTAGIVIYIHTPTTGSRDSDHILQDLRIRYPENYGIYTNNTDTTSVKITNVKIDNSANIGAYLGSGDSLITQSTVRDSVSDGWYIQGSGQLMVDCKAYNNCKNDNTSCAGFRVISQQNTFVNIVAENNYQNGLAAFLASASGNSVIGSAFWDNGQSGANDQNGIYLYNQQYWNIIGCQFDNQGTKTQQYGIKLSGTAGGIGNISIIGNFFRNQNISNTLSHRYAKSVVWYGNTNDKGYGQYNISLISRNLTKFCCGVDNAGSWGCRQLGSAIIEC